MIYYSNYYGHLFNNTGKRKLYDDTIYTFDIETTSYFILDDVVHESIDYLMLTQKEKDRCIKQSNMYIWMFGINGSVYYGRTWEEFKEFLEMIEHNNPDGLKFIYVHNLSFEFQFLKGLFTFENVMARKMRKVIRAKMKKYNVEFRCTYYIANAALEELPKLFQLDVKKLTGNLDYSKLRNSKTELSEDELSYCENDILVLYEYIKKELVTYEEQKQIPNTSTGKVRRELKKKIEKDYNYKNKVRSSINVDPHIFNLLQDAFMGGYTHANYCYTDEILKNVDSYDETSAYPYVLVAYKYPSSEFQKVNIKDRKEMLKTKAYLLHVLFTHVKSKYYNNFISGSKCQRIRGAKYDNGRIISAEEIEITLTDIDFYFLLDAYYLEYEILEIYEANYAYLPHKFVDFILEKYVKKTQYKNVAGMELEYTKEKNNFNALYGMSVTNTIRDKVIYNNETKEWHEEELINDEIIEALLNEKKKGFLSFSYGVWVTAYARNNLLRRVLDLDEFVVYCDTDSIKLVSGYPKKIFEDYNKSVLNRLDRISKIRNIPVENFFPKDKDGIAHPLGIFEHEANYQEFITQGAKKYCYKENNKIAITVSGVPKKAACSLNKVSDFRDNYIFKFKDTNKNCMIYNDHQIEIELIDYQGNHEIVKDICGACLLPLNYPLRKSHDYANLLNDMSSARARFKE